MMNFLLLLADPNDKKGQLDINPQAITEKLDSWLDGFVKLIPNLVVGILVFIAIFYVARWIGNLVRRLLGNKGRENFGELLGGFARYIIVILGFAFSITIMAPNLSLADLIGGLGVSTVAIGFAFQDILQNWLAGVLILLRQPFKLGDQIVVNNYEGTVEEIKMRATIIKTYDGKRVVIPNNTVYNNSVTVNTAHELIRSQYDMGLGYNENYLEAMQILKETITNVEGVNKDHTVETLVWDQADSWLTIRVRWWTKSDRASVVSVRSRVLLETQQAMNEAGIDLPFPSINNVIINPERKENSEDKIIKSKEALQNNS